MDFSQRVKDLSARSRHASQHALTEEATKTSVILPLIQALAPQIDGADKKAADAASGAEVVTTDDERQAFMIVRAIASRVANVHRITMRDAISYCSIFVDDNNRKPVCRLYFNAKSSKSIGIFAPQPDKTESKLQIEDLSDIYKFAVQIEATVKSYL